MKETEAAASPSTTLTEGQRMRTYHCTRTYGKTRKRCGRIIPMLRAAVRLAQGKKPLYCSNDCLNATTQKRSRAKGAA
jgi:hypothetical protein